MKHHVKWLAVAMLAVFTSAALAQSASASVLVYDEFDSTGFGDNTWVSDFNGAMVQTQGQLQYTLANQTGWVGSTRDFATPITVGVGQSIWMSYTVQASADFNGYYMIENTTNGFRYFEVDTSSIAPSSHYKMAGQDTALNLGDMMTGLVKLTYDGTSMNAQAYYATDPNALLDTSGKPIGTPLTGSFASDGTLASVEIQASTNNAQPWTGMVNLDRISFATTAAEALGTTASIPEPASGALALLGLGGLMMVKRRRRA